MHISVLVPKNPITSQGFTLFLRFAFLQDFLVISQFLFSNYQVEKIVLSFDNKIRF